jgi:hypothetical protein
MKWTICEAENQLQRHEPFDNAVLGMLSISQKQAWTTGLRSRLRSTQGYQGHSPCLVKLRAFLLLMHAARDYMTLDEACVNYPRMSAATIGA